MDHFPKELIQQIKVFFHSQDLSFWFWLSVHSQNPFFSPIMFSGSERRKRVKRRSSSRARTRGGNRTKREAQLKSRLGAQQLEDQLPTFTHSPFRHRRSIRTRVFQSGRSIRSKSRGGSLTLFWLIPRLRSLSLFLIQGRRSHWKRERSQMTKMSCGIPC